MSTITECPFCGSKEGYYEKERYKGTCFVEYNFNGSYKDNRANAGMYQDADHTRLKGKLT